MLLVIISLILLYVVFTVAKKHGPKTHKRALIKGGFLWGFSTSPIIIALLLRKVPNEEAMVLPENSNSSRSDTPEVANTSDGFIDHLTALFSIEEMFVYSASFLAPVIYIAIDTMIKMIDNEFDPTGKEIRENLRGMQWVFLIGLLLLILTISVFSAAKSGSDISDTYFYRFLGGQPIWIYGLSILLWYLTILHNEPQVENPGKGASKSSTSLANGLKERFGFSVDNVTAKGNEDD